MRLALPRTTTLALATTLAACATTPPPAAPPPAVAAAPAPAPKPAPKPAAPPAPEDPWANRGDLLEPPPTAYDTKVELGAIERFRLPNGAQILFVPRKAAPVINLAVGLRGGRLAEPVDRAGLAAFTALMLRKGTQRRTADRISKDLESRGATLTASAGGETLTVRCGARSTELDVCLDNVVELLLMPTFPEKELAEVRSQLLASIASRRDSPAGVADMHWRNQLYGEDDPRGRPLSERSLKSIDRAALVRFHRETFEPSRAVVSLSGDFDAKQARQKIERALSAWKPLATAAPRTSAPTPSGKLLVRMVDKPDATQAAIAFAAPAFASSSPDYPAVTLMNYILGGGGFSSRLMQTVRSNGAKTYGIRSRFEIGRVGGAWVISTSTRTAETAATIKLVQAELDKLRAGGVDPGELQRAKANLIGGYGLSLETAADVGESLLAAELDGQGQAFVTEWPGRLDKVTVEDVARVAKQYLQPAVLVVAGNRALIAPQLATLGLEVGETVAFTDPVSVRERAMASGASDPARQLLDAVWTQKGGAANDKVKYLVLSGHGTMTVGSKQVPVTIEERYLPPSAVRVEMKLGNQALVQVLGPTRSYIENGNQRQELPAPLLAEMRKAYWREPHFVVSNAHRPEVKVALAPALKRQNGELQVLEVTSPTGEVVQLVVEPESRDVVEIRYTEGGKPGVDLLSDYRPVEGGGGLRAPFHAVRKTAGGDVLDIVYDKILVGENPDPKQFE